MENIPCKNGAPPAHARGRRNLWSIYPLHTPHKGPGAAFPQGSGISGHSRTRGAICHPCNMSRPARHLPRASVQSGPQHDGSLTGMAPGPTIFSQYGPVSAGTAMCKAFLPATKKDRHPQGRRSFCLNAFLLPSPGQTSCTMLLSRPLQSRNNRRYFFRASESTMAWAWASSTFPASRTSTCLSAPRASTPRMGMFPAWPCIS